MIDQYNGDYSEIISLEELKYKVCINALCFTPTISDAAKEVGIAENNMYKIVQRLDLKSKDIKEMRKAFKESKKKVKLRYKRKR